MRRQCWNCRPIIHARPCRPSVAPIARSYCPAELTHALRATCRREGVTRYMFLLAAFYALLTRYTGQRDLLVGTPVANRTRVETEGLVGLFANTLVLRARLEDKPSFAELLQRVREAVLGAHQHQQVPFERLVEELQPERDLSRTPLFQVMFVAAEEEATGGWQLPGLELSAERVETGTSKFELTLFVTAEGEGLRVTAEYNTDLFAEQSMERLLGHYGRLLAAAVADAGQPVVQLSLLSAAEREQLLVEWNETRRGYGGELLHEMFAAQVGRTPASGGARQSGAGAELCRTGWQSESASASVAGARGGSGDTSGRADGARYGVGGRAVGSAQSWWRLRAPGRRVSAGTTQLHAGGLRRPTAADPAACAGADGVAGWSGHRSRGC